MGIKLIRENKTKEAELNTGQKTHQNGAQITKLRVKKIKEKRN